MTTVLGIYTGHDQSACLVRDGEILVAIEEERLTRVKHSLPKDLRDLWPRFRGRFGYFPWASLSYCLEAGGLGLDELDALVLSEDAASTDLVSILPLKDKSKILIASEPVGGAHHYRHALSTFLASPFSEAAVLVMDGDGGVTSEGYEAETGYRFSDRRGSYEEVFKNRYPLGEGLRGGLGWTYDYVSAILGFVATEIGYLSQPGKTMGLAPYGAPSPELAEPWIESQGFKLDFAPFHEWLEAAGHSERLRFDSRERALIQSEAQISRQAKDLAWKVQHELEEAALHLARELHAATGAKQLCLAGGVALNSVANGRIAREGPFEEVFVQPAADDRGQAIGLAYQGYLKLQAARDAPEVAPIAHAYGGKRYPDKACKLLLKRAMLSYRELKGPTLAREAAAKLAAGQIVAWFQGGSELGPRALGHRSILADPRQADMKERLNARVKFRESFRPFAPSVLAERAAEVFELAGQSPYMLQVAPVREPWRARVPAIVHEDGTARVQTVTAASQPTYRALIEAFAEQTGVPLLLNTSFNLRGEPIVESPEDALRTFCYTEIDVLYLGPYEVKAPASSRVFPRLATGWELVVENRIDRGDPRLKVWFEEAESAKKVPVRPLPELVALVTALDGKRSLQEAMQVALEGAPAPDVAKACERFVRLMLRSGPLALRVGDLDL